MSVVDIGTIASRFQIKDLEKQLANLEKVEQKINDLEGRTIRVDTKGFSAVNQEMNKLGLAFQSLESKSQTFKQIQGQLTGLLQKRSRIVDQLTQGSHKLAQAEQSVAERQQVIREETERTALSTQMRNKRMLEDSRFRIQLAQKNIANLRAERQAIDDNVNALRSQTAFLQSGPVRAISALQRVGGGLRSTFSALSEPFKNVVSVMSRGRQAMLGMADQITHLGQVAAATAFRLQLLLTPIQLIASSVAKSAIEFQHAVAFIATQSKTSGDEVVEFQQRTADAIRNVTNTMAVTNAEAAEAMFTLVGSLNLSEDAALKLLPVISKLAVAGDAHAASVAELGVLLLATFAPDALSDPIRAAEELDKMLGQVLVTMKDGTGTLQDYVEQAGDFVDVGKVVGGELPEMLALFTLLTQRRGEAEAATQLKRLQQTVLTPKFAEVTESLGVSLTKINEEGKEVLRGPFQIFTDLAEILNEPTRETLETISKVFPNIRAELPFLAFLTPEVRDRWAELVQELKNTPEVARQVDEDFNTMSNTTQNLFQVMGQALENIGTLVEQDLRERLGGGIKVITEGFVSLQNMPKETRQALTQFLLILSALPPLMLAVSVAILGAGGLVSALATLASPVVLGIAGVLLRTFSDELTILKDVAAKFDLTTLDGIANFLAQVGMALGIINQEQIDEIFEKLQVKQGSGEEYKQIQEAFQGIGETVSSTVGFLRTWVDAFGEFFDMIERREGIIGNLIQLFEFVASALGRAPGGSLFEGSGGKLDLLIGGFLLRPLAKALLKGIATKVMHVSAGVVNLGKQVAFGPPLGPGTPRGPITGPLAGLFARGPLGMLGFTAMAARSSAASPSRNRLELERVLAQAEAEGIPIYRKAPEGGGGITGMLKRAWQRVADQYGWGPEVQTSLDGQIDGLHALLEAFGASGVTLEEQTSILMDIRELLGQPLAEGPMSLPDEAWMQRMRQQGGSIWDFLMRVEGPQPSPRPGMRNIFDFIQRIEGTRPFPLSHFPPGALPTTGASAQLTPILQQLSDVLVKLSQSGVNLSEAGVVDLVNQFQEADTTRQQEIIQKLESVLTESTRRQENALGRLATSIYALANRIGNPAPFISAFMDRGNPLRPTPFHTGGFIDLLRSEFVTSPITTRLLESVVGDRLTQQNLQQLALAHAGVQNLTHNVNITPSRAFDIRLSARGLTGFELSQGQKEELGWEITGFVADRLRETFHGGR